MFKIWKNGLNFIITPKGIPLFEKPNVIKRNAFHFFESAQKTIKFQTILRKNIFADLCNKFFCASWNSFSLRTIFDLVSVVENCKKYINIQIKCTGLKVCLQKKLFHI